MTASFLTRVARQALSASIVRPRTASRFESPRDSPRETGFSEQTVEHEASRPPEPSLRPFRLRESGEPPSDREPRRAGDEGPENDSDSPHASRSAPRAEAHAGSEPSQTHVIRETIKVERLVASSSDTQPARASERAPEILPKSSTFTTAEEKPQHFSEAPASSRPPVELRHEIVRELVTRQPPPELRARENDAHGRAAGTQPALPAAAPERVRSREPAAPSPIEIVIGRIEIRAVNDEPKQTPRSAPAATRTPALGLADYLRHREGQPQ